MHTIYSRINNVSAMLSTCLMVLLGAISLSSFLFTTTPPPGHLSVTNIKVFPGNARRYSNKNQDFTFVNFNLTAGCISPFAEVLVSVLTQSLFQDLTPLFNWNTKQLFLYVAAEYENKQGTKNDVVIWDRIVRRKEDAQISVAGRNKYVFREVSASFG
uniref:Signal peptidase subunit 3 n=1 Tax=Ganoderma boninense TaxID=34458 RepID=A0A5K1K8T0_9APHY|nr:D-xylose-proton symporter [Ganoderma boninense]